MILPVALDAIFKAAFWNGSGPGEVGPFMRSGFMGALVFHMKDAASRDG